MSRVLVVSARYRHENPFRELTIVEALRARGVDAQLVLPARNLNPAGYPPAAAALPPFVERDSLYIDDLHAFARLAWGADAVLTGNHKENSRFCSIAGLLGRLVVDFDSVSGMDGWPMPHSRASLVKGPHQQRLLDVNYAHDYPNMDVVVTGSPAHEFIAGAAPTESREAFLRRYNLDPARPTAALFPKGLYFLNQKLKNWFGDGFEEARAWYLRTYRAICDAVERANVNLIVKLHPTAYVAYRFPVEEERALWAGAPNVRILEPADTYPLLTHADVGLGVLSHSVMDFGYFRKPFVFIEHQHAPRLMRLQDRIHAAGTGLPPGPSSHWGNPEPYPHADMCYFPNWVGHAVSVGELAGLLTSGAYREVQPAHFDRFIAEYWHRADGNAAGRIAEYVVGALAQHPARNTLPARARLLLRRY